MTGRTSSRRRSKTQRLIDSEEQETVGVSPSGGGRSKRASTVNVQKPKYLDSVEHRSETPSSSRSRLSTPASSRATSRSPTPTKPAKKTKSKRRYGLVFSDTAYDVSIFSDVTNSAPSRSSTRKKKTTQTFNGRAGNSGSATPLSRASRSSSVSSSRKKPAAPTPSKVKTKLGRGYNPSLVNYKESEYHYGSDFDESEDENIEYDDDEAEKSDESSDDNGDESLEEAASSDLEVESDMDEWNTDAQSVPTIRIKISTPVPFWLKTEEEEEIKELKLPKSSDDLLISASQSFQAAGIYEVLRHYYLILRLSLFRFEDFCAALASEEQSNLLSEVHTALLKAIVRAEEKDNTQWGPMDHKDSINALFFFVDSMTWPEALRQFLASDPQVFAEPLAVLNEYQEYPVQGTFF